MSLTVTPKGSEQYWGQKISRIVTVDFDSSYPTGGESFLPENYGVKSPDAVLIESKSGYAFEYDYTNKKIKAYTPTNMGDLTFTGSAPAGHTHVFSGDALAGHNHTFTGAVITPGTANPVDSDAAAATGIAVYAHLVTSAIANLKSVTAGNANAVWATGNGDIVVFDDDNAATGGFQVFFDEDGAGEDQRFLINNTLTGEDLFVHIGNGTVLRLKHDANAATAGVALYFDDDGATAADRMLFVSPTNANGTGETDDAVTHLTGVAAGTISSDSAGTPAGTNASTVDATPAGTITGEVDTTAAEVANATDLSAVTGVRVLIVGR